MSERSNRIYKQNLKNQQGSRFFPKVREYNLILNSRDSDVLAALINIVCMNFTELDENRFFVCTNEKLQKETYMSWKSIHTALKSLKNKNYITIKRQNKHAGKRMIHIRNDVIWEDIYEKLDENLEPKKFVNSSLCCDRSVTTSHDRSVTTSHDRSVTTPSIYIKEPIIKEPCREKSRPSVCSTRYFKWAKNFVKTICKIQKYNTFKIRHL